MRKKRLLATFVTGERSRGELASELGISSQPVQGFSEDFDYDPIGNRRLEDLSGQHSYIFECNAPTYMVDPLGLLALNLSFSWGPTRKSFMLGPWFEGDISMSGNASLSGEYNNGEIQGLIKGISHAEVGGLVGKSFEMRISRYWNVMGRAGIRLKVFLFGGLFFVAGCFIGLGGYFNIKSDSSLCNDQWICLTGNVVRFSHNICVSSSNGGGGGNLFSCEYSYEIGGKQYRSDQLCIGLSSVDEQRKIEKRIKNNTVPVWVNANNPSVSVLVNPKEHGYWGSILLFAVALCMFIGAIVIWFIAVWENQGEHKDQSLLT